MLIQQSNPARQNLKHLELTPTALERMIEAWLERLPESAKGSLASARAALIQKFLALDSLASLETCKTRFAAGPYRDTENFPSEAYRERVLSLGQGHLMVTGLRFKNDDAYVEVTPTRSLLGEADIRRVAEFACGGFARFSPRGILFTDLYTAEAAQNSNWELWDCAVVGSLDEAAPTGALPDGVTIQAAESFDFYELYVKEYQNWKRSAPQLSAHVRIESHADLTRAATDGLLANVFLDGEWCGVIAGQDKKYYGTEGLYVFEKFLSAKTRGRGFAKSIERNFLRSMRERFGFVWGLIYGGNEPSLKSAYDQGRAPVEAQYFVSL